MANKSLGGEDLAFDAQTGSGQRGVTGGAGANNIGLLVKVLGRCVVNVRGDYYGANYIFIDDGSGIKSFYRAVDGSYLEVSGVKVEVDDASMTEGDYVIATGISSIEQVNGVFQRRLLVRITDGNPELQVVAQEDS